MPAANGTRLVAASSLFARLPINLSPFAFELPGLYLPFVKILKDMGLKDMLSVTHAKDLLSNLQKACGYQRLNPNELRAVMEILHFVCDKTMEANTSDPSNWESGAIVPDDGCRLVHAKSCVYVDSYGSRYIKHIDTARLRLVNPDVPEKICTALGIKMLSDVVVEVHTWSAAISFAILSVPLSQGEFFLFRLHQNGRNVFLFLVDLNLQNISGITNQCQHQPKRTQTCQILRNSRNIKLFERIRNIVQNDLFSN